MITMRVLIRHSAAGFFAVFIGILTFLPQVAAEHRMGSEYLGVHPQMNDDELYYTARAHEVLDGHPGLSNPFLYEYKDKPAMQFWLPDALLAWGSILIFGDIHIGALWWDFFLPAILFLVTYSILLLLVRDRLLVLGIVVLLHLGIFFELFNRSPSPQLNFLFVLIFFLAAIKAITTRQTMWVVIAGICFGSLFYVYTYFWTYIAVTLALLVVASPFFFKKEYFRVFAPIFFAGLVIGVPYFFEMSSTATLPLYDETLARLGMLTTHAPSGITIVVLATIVLFLYGFLWYFRLLSCLPLPGFLIVNVLAGAIVVNQHIVTGQNLEFSSHYRLIAVFADAFALAYAVGIIHEKISTQKLRDYFRLCIASIFIVISLVHGIRIAFAQSVPGADVFEAQRYAPILEWLDGRTTKDDVVFADDALSPYIPAYTHNNVFFTQGALLFFVPQSEIRERFLIQHYFDKTFSVDDVVRLERQIYGTYYINRYAHQITENRLRRVLGLKEDEYERFPDSDIQSLVEEEQALRGQIFLEAFDKYRVDYVVWDKSRHPEWSVASSAELSEMYQYDNIVIYKIIK